MKKIFITFFILFNFFSYAHSQNVALGKNATQSGTYAGRVAGRAVDGVASSIDNELYCSTAESNSNQTVWWQVDLANLYAVSSVEIFNTDDAEEYRYLSDFIIYVSIDSSIMFSSFDSSSQWTICYTFDEGNFTVPRNGSMTFSCSSPQAGRYVTIERGGGGEGYMPNMMTLCEVEIVGIELTDVALNCPATQSGTYYGRVAGRAVDGNSSSADNELHCSTATTNPSYGYTGSNPNAWWQVDLGNSYVIYFVIIYNTNNSNEYGYLSDFSIFISSGSDISVAAMRLICYTYGQTTVPIPQGSSQLFHCTPQIGNFVTIQRLGGGYMPGWMTLCEVQVMATRYYYCTNSNCDLSVACTSYQGCKRCFPGYQLPDCTDVCSAGTYGVNCEQTCIPCAVTSETCDPVTGDYQGVKGCNPTTTTIASTPFSMNFISTSNEVSTRMTSTVFNNNSVFSSAVMTTFHASGWIIAVTVSLLKTSIDREK